MTLGFTGVVWLPRLAEGNSAMLHAGAHAVPLFAATASWGVLTAAWTDAVATIARVVAELGVGLQSPNGVASIARLTNFGVWAEQTATTAGIMTAKTANNAAQYVGAALTMPSPVEIAIAAAAEVAAHSTGGILNGTAEAAEAYKRSLDIRAALVMEAYEAATSATLATPPASFTLPPPITSGIDFGAGLGKNTLGQAITSATVGAVTHLQNAGTVAAQAGEVAGGTASAASQVGTSAVSAAAGPSSPALGQAISPLAGLSGVAVGSGSATRAVSSQPQNDAPAIKLPEGWGTPGGAGGTVASTVAAVAAGVPYDPAATRPAASAPPVASQPPRNNDDDEDNRPTPEYLKSPEFFSEGTDIAGRAVTPAVIGATTRDTDND